MLQVSLFVAHLFPFQSTHFQKGPIVQVNKPFDLQQKTFEFIFSLHLNLFCRGDMKGFGVVVKCGYQK